MATKPDSLDYKKRSYSVVPYDEKWEEWYSILEAQLKQVFEDCQPDVYHVGSTAVKGMASKPALDVLVVVPDISCLDRHLAELKRYGYEIHHDQVTPDTILAIKHSDGVRKENIHIIPNGHRHIDDMLNFRNYMLSHPYAASEYSELKLALFKKYPKDYASYRKEKNAWLKKELKKAAE